MIAIIGRRRLGRGFATALSPHHEVVLGSRDPYVPSVSIKWCGRRTSNELPVTGADLTLALLGALVMVAVGARLRRRAG